VSVLVRLEVGETDHHGAGVKGRGDRTDPFRQTFHEVALLVRIAAGEFLDRLAVLPFFDRSGWTRAMGWTLMWLPMINSIRARPTPSFGIR